MPGRSRAFSAGRYVSDLHVGESQPLQVRAFRIVLSAFVRGTVHLHYGTRQQAQRRSGARRLRRRATVHPAVSLAPETGGAAGGAGLVSIVEASTT